MGKRAGELIEMLAEGVGGGVVLLWSGGGLFFLLLLRERK